MKSKLILTTLGLVALLATPALAQKPQNRAMAPNTIAAGSPDFTSGSPSALYVDGRYVGNDPDPSIRSELLRDAQTALGVN